VIEEPIWRTLWNGVQDVLFPKKLPPLELTSQPVAVVDRMAVKRDPKSSAVSFVVHVVVVALILLMVLADWKTRAVQKSEVTTVTVPYIPPARLTAPMGGGGGGGTHSLVEASKGKLPKMVKNPITPPQILKMDHPILPVEAAVKMPQPLKLPDAANMPNIGVPNSPQVKFSSQGTGSNSGFGTGSGGGIGAGNGNGVGSGSGGGYGGGVYHVGGGVSEPVLIYSVEPEFSDEARRAKYQGICIVQLIVDAQGNPQDVKVIRPLGMGLDQKAVDAVKQYRFRPAMFHGKAVPVIVNIAVNFRIY
jgi:TonB family protein